MHAQIVTITTSSSIYETTPFHETSEQNVFKQKSRKGTDGITFIVRDRRHRIPSCR